MDRESRHYKEEIQELLDNRLSPHARAQLESHLGVCPECCRELEALRWTKQFSSRHYAASTMPASLEENLLQALDLEDRSHSPENQTSRFWWPSQRPILVYGFLVFAAVILIFSYFIKFPQLPSEVAQDYWNYGDQKLPLDLETSDVKEMENFFLDHGIHFETRVFDLGMMNYGLAGGRVHQLINRQSALFVYRREGNKRIICQMYPGKATELPAGSMLRQNNGIQFHIYRLKELTLVFWQEGAVTCVLTSDIDGEEVIQLAFAKAVKI